MHTLEQSRYSDHKLLDNTNSSLSQILLFGKSFFDTNDKTKITTQQLTTFSELKDSMDHFNKNFFYFFCLCP